MLKRLFPALVLVFFTIMLNAQCPNGRYYNKIFGVTTHTNVLFGNAMKFDSTYQDLSMNIYEPDGDNFAHRPLIILAFGGSFTAGIKESPDIVNLCNEFTRRGYVCSSIDYRLGFEDGNDSDTNQFRALIRGVQDMKAAVRFFYKDALTTNTYRIDTSQIFIGGVSAGAFIALNYAYGKIDTFSIIPPVWGFPTVLALGGPEGNSGNPGYGTKVKGVIDLCGALADTVWIMPNDPILVGVHGYADSLVRCQFDSVYAAQAVESRLFGTCDIETRATNIGLSHSLYFFNGMGHVPFILPTDPLHNPLPYMDTTVWTIRDFLAPNTVCDSTQFVSGFEPVEEGVAVSVFPNPSSEGIFVSSSQSNALTARVLSVEGKLLMEETIAPDETIYISKNRLSEGVYLLQLTDKVHPEKKKVERLVFQ